MTTRKLSAFIPRTYELSRKRLSQTELELLQPLDVVSQLRRFLKFQVARLFKHFCLEFLDLAHDGLGAQIDGRLRAARPIRAAALGDDEEKPAPKEYDEFRLNMLIISSGPLDDQNIHHVLRASFGQPFS